MTFGWYWLQQRCNGDDTIASRVSVSGVLAAAVLGVKADVVGQGSGAAWLISYLLPEEAHSLAHGTGSTLDNRLCLNRLARRGLDPFRFKHYLFLNKKSYQTVFWRKFTLSISLIMHLVDMPSLWCGAHNSCVSRRCVAHNRPPTMSPLLP